MHRRRPRPRARSFRRSYNKGVDSFGAFQIPTELGVLYLIVPAAGLALLLHPSLNGNWYTDVAWTIALYIEAVAILPQLLMFQKSHEKEVEPFTANFVFFTAVARLMHFVFWLSSYHELNDKYSTVRRRRMRRRRGAVAAVGADKNA